MIGWIAYVRKNKVLARLEELEDRVQSLHDRLVRRESAEGMRKLREQRRSSASEELAAEAANILSAGGASERHAPPKSTGGKSDLYGRAFKK